MTISHILQPPSRVRAQLRVKPDLRQSCLWLTAPCRCKSHSYQPYPTTKWTHWLSLPYREAVTHQPDRSRWSRFSCRPSRTDGEPKQPRGSVWVPEILTTEKRTSCSFPKSFGPPGQNFGPTSFDFSGFEPLRHFVEKILKPVFDQVSKPSKGAQWVVQSPLGCSPDPRKLHFITN